MQPDLQTPPPTARDQDREQRCTAPHPAVSLLLSLTAFAILVIAALVLLTLL